jgi:hypothetical protein
MTLKPCPRGSYRNRRTKECVKKATYAGTDIVPTSKLMNDVGLHSFDPKTELESLKKRGLSVRTDAAIRLAVSLEYMEVKKNTPKADALRQRLVNFAIVFMKATKSKMLLEAHVKYAMEAELITEGKHPAELKKDTTHAERTIDYTMARYRSA